MGATIKGALGALAAIALAGCSGTGGQSPTEAHSAPVSAEVRQLADVVRTSDHRLRLDSLGARFDDNHCAVHLARNDATPEWSECRQIRQDIGSSARRMLDELDFKKPWPAEADATASGTTEALRGLMAAAGETDPEQMTLSLAIFRGSLKSWSTVAG